MMEKEFNDYKEAEQYYLTMRKAFHEPRFSHTLYIKKIYVVRSEGGIGGKKENGNKDKR